MGIDRVRMPDVVVSASDSAANAKFVADYLCDGVNDEVQINAALLAVSAAGGGVVLLPAGTFSIDDAILMQDDTTLRGSGWQTKLVFVDHLGADSSHPVISNVDRTGGNSNIVVENLYCDGNKGTTGTPKQVGWDTTAFPDTDGQGNRGCFSFRTVTNITVNRCRIDEAWATGIELEQCTGFDITRNRIHKSADDGIGINIGSSEGSVAQNIISEVAKDRAYGGGSGIEIQDGVFGVTVAGNTIKDFSVSGPQGIQISSHTDEDPCYEIAVTGNAITNIHFGINVGGDPTPAHDITISGNTIAVLDRGIDVMVCEKVAITGNTIVSSGASGEGIYAPNTSSDIVVSGNMIVTTASASSGIHFDTTGTFTAWSVVGNNIQAAYAGIQSQDKGAMVDMVFARNTFNGGLSGAGFFMRMGTATFSGCRFEDNTFDVDVNVPIRPYNSGEVDIPVGWSVARNQNAQAEHTREFLDLENHSGVTSQAGWVVIDSSPNTNDIGYSTTTAAGDSMVVGVVDKNTANGSVGKVQVGGKVTNLKVDGTNDIAIGDLLSTFTTAGIAQKATAGDMAFAYALEAYSTDDSSGVIDAYLITPRTLP